MRESRKRRQTEVPALFRIPESFSRDRRREDRGGGAHGVLLFVRDAGHTCPDEERRTCCPTEDSLNAGGGGNVLFLKGNF